MATRRIHYCFGKLIEYRKGDGDGKLTYGFADGQWGKWPDAQADIEEVIRKAIRKRYGKSTPVWQYCYEVTGQAGFYYLNEKGDR